MKKSAQLASSAICLGFAVAALGLAGCEKKPEEKKASGPPPTLVTAARATVRPLEVIEETVGSIENMIDPKIGAEVAGRVTQVLAGTGKVVKKGDLLAVIEDGDFRIQAQGDAADLARLQTLLTQQERVVERQRELVNQNFVSKNALDDATAQRDALRSQISSARAKSAATSSSLTKARVISPIDGAVEAPIVAVGDYVKVGDPLFRMVGNRLLHVHLLFPEAMASRLKPGMLTRISSPQVPGKVWEAPIHQIRPTIGETNRAIDAIVRLEDAEGLSGGGTVNGAVVLATKGTAVMVPESAVVLRPAGKVVYALAPKKDESTASGPAPSDAPAGEPKVDLKDTAKPEVKPREGKSESKADGATSGGPAAPGAPPAAAPRRPMEARQIIVTTGVKQGGLVEITTGLKGGELLAVDGAGFLTNNANVLVAPPRGGGSGGSGGGGGPGSPGSPGKGGPAKDGGKAEFKADVKTETKAEPKGEAKSDTKPAGKSESKSEAKAG